MWTYKKRKKKKNRPFYRVAAQLKILHSFIFSFYPQSGSSNISIDVPALAYRKQDQFHQRKTTPLTKTPIYTKSAEWNKRQQETYSKAEKLPNSQSIIKSFKETSFEEEFDSLNFEKIAQKGIKKNFRATDVPKINRLFSRISRPDRPFLELSDDFQKANLPQFDRAMSPGQGKRSDFYSNDQSRSGIEQKVQPRTFKKNKNQKQLIDAKVGQYFDEVENYVGNVFPKMSFDESWESMKTSFASNVPKFIQ